MNTKMQISDTRFQFLTKTKHTDKYFFSYNKTTFFHIIISL